MSAQNVKAQSSNDHLQPLEGIYDMPDFLFDYYTKVRKVLFYELSANPEIRFQVMPSFTPEEILQIEYDKSTDKHKLVYRICEDMIWSNENWEKVKIKEFISEINKESVDLLKELFVLAISKTRFPENEHFGLDGDYYFFSINNLSLKSGTVWSPQDGTKMKKLVDIGLELIDMIKSEKKLQKMDNVLQKRIENLINELKQN